MFCVISFGRLAMTQAYLLVAVSAINVLRALYAICCILLQRLLEILK